jgi:hypothetical protein
MFIDNTLTNIVIDCLFAMFIVNTLDDIVNNYVYLSCLCATPIYINNVCIKCM